MPEGSGKVKVLIVEDEARIVELLRLYLEREGYQVVAAGDGPGALEQFHRERPDLILLDLNLPGMDGLEVCRRLRAQGNTPIIMLTARTEEMDRILGLELGADDYIPKPFSPREVVARVRAVLRRTSPAPAPQERQFGDLVVDLARHEVRLEGKVVELTPTEFRLLEALTSQPGRVFSRLQLLERVWGDAYEGYDRTIDAHIKNLRHKLRGDLIHTVFGVGYKFREEQQ